MVHYLLTILGWTENFKYCYVTAYSIEPKQTRYYWQTNYTNWKSKNSSFSKYSHNNTKKGLKDFRWISILSVKRQPSGYANLNKLHNFDRVETFLYVSIGVIFRFKGSKTIRKCISVFLFELIVFDI